MSKISVEWVFVHIPKTGGTSIRKALSESLGTKYGAAINRHGHATLAQHRRRFEESAWQEMIAFTVIRHPFDRLVSSYAYMRSWQNRKATPESFREWVHEGCPLPLIPFCWTIDGEERTIVDPQTKWLDRPFMGPNIHLLRFESLEEHWALFAPRIGADPRLPKLNASVDRLPWPAYYDEATRAVALSRYAEDLDHFGYEA